MVRPRLLLTVLVLLAPCALLTALANGSLALGWDPLGWLLDGSSLQRQVLLQLRLPRALSGFVTGATLAVAGSLMQVLLRNPLADPYILGVSGGAAVATLLGILAGLGGWALSGSAFAGAMLSTLLVFGLARGRGSWTSTRLLLTGVVVAAGWGALITLILALSPQSYLRGMLFWLMGDLTDAYHPGPAAAALAVGLALSMPLARDLNVAARGDLEAAALGVDVGRLRRRIYFLASLLTAAAVTLAGNIGFVGLVVPHMVRLLGGTDHRVLLPGAALLGGSLLTLADTLARTALAPQQLPVGVITALIGVPVFLLLLRSGRT